MFSLKNMAVDHVSETQEFSDLRAATSLHDFKLNLRHHIFEWVLTRRPSKAAFSI